MKRLFLILSAALALSCSFAKPNPHAASYKTYETTDKNAPVVYFIRDISPEGLSKVYDALGFEAKGKVGVKISTGESNRSNHLRPSLIGDFVKKHGGVIVECNTAYGGNRASNAAHKQAFKDRGIEIVTPTPEQMDEFKTKTQPAFDKFAAEIPADLLKLLQDTQK